MIQHLKAISYLIPIKILSKSKIKIQTINLIFCVIYKLNHTAQHVEEISKLIQIKILKRVKTKIEIYLNDTFCTLYCNKSHHNVKSNFLVYI